MGTQSYFSESILFLSALCKNMPLRIVAELSDEAPLTPAPCPLGGEGGAKRRVRGFNHLSIQQNSITQSALEGHANPNSEDNPSTEPFPQAASNGFQKQRVQFLAIPFMVLYSDHAAN
jgi:hypothetical protein